MQIFFHEIKFVHVFFSLNSKKIDSNFFAFQISSIS